jgi:hypothetical protein
MLGTHECQPSGVDSIPTGPQVIISTSFPHTKSLSSLPWTSLRVTLQSFPNNCLSVVVVAHSSSFFCLGLTFKLWTNINFPVFSERRDEEKQFFLNGLV